MRILARPRQHSESNPTSFVSSGLASARAVGLFHTSRPGPSTRFILQYRLRRIIVLGHIVDTTVLQVAAGKRPYIAIN